MNVIVSNKQKHTLENANIDSIKELNGLFKVDDLINNFRNYFFTKMIVDATSIVEFANPMVLKRLVDGIGSEKLVILLPSKPEPPKKFLKMLISLRIYNFSSDINDIVKFLQTPNTYDDVKGYLNEPVINNFNEINNNFNNTNNLGNIEDFNDDLDVDDENDYFDTDSNTYDDINKSLTNMSSSVNDYLNGNSDHQEHSNFEILNKNNNETKFNTNDKYVLGIKNVTKHAGTTTLIYMLKNTLEYRFNKKVLALEVKTRDFTYFRSKDMISVSEDKLETMIRNNDYDIILLDLNNNNYDSLCNDIIYLVEPSIINVNRLILGNRTAFASLKNKKVVLNKSLISSGDVNKFSQESGLSFYFVIPPLNDRVGNSIIENLINKLGL